MQKVSNSWENKIKVQKAKCKTKLKDQNQELKIFLSFDLDFTLCVLLFALFYYILRITDF